MNDGTEEVTTDEGQSQMPEELVNPDPVDEVAGAEDESEAEAEAEETAEPAEEDGDDEPSDDDAA